MAIKRDLWVAIYDEDTQANQFRDTDRRKDELEAAIQAAYDWIKTKLDKNREYQFLPDALFVAPEYLFAKETTGSRPDQQIGDVRQIDEQSKVALEKFF